MTSSIGSLIRESLCDDLSKTIFDVREKWTTDKENRSFSMFRGVAEFRDSIDQVMDCFKLLKNKKYIVYGSGIYGGVIMDYMKDYSLIENCIAVWDSDPSKWNKAFRGYTISPPLANDGSADYVIITTAYDGYVDEITDTLTGKMFSNSQLIKLSKQFLNPIYQNSAQYFDKEIILPRLSDNEIFIDAGSETFSTSLQFLELARNVKKIYAFECSNINAPTVKKAVKACGFGNIQFEQCALWSSNTQLFFEEHQLEIGLGHVSSEGNVIVQAKTLDEIVPDDETITFIKMDIEGAELEALKGAARIIRRDKPKLAISVYHKDNDYFEIPAYIRELVPEYKMYMRHYRATSADTVLYCVL